MTLVNQSEFARLCGVSRQAVLKWKNAGMLVLQGGRVDVEATNERMRRYHPTGSPLRRQPVGAVDSQLTNGGLKADRLTKIEPDSSTVRRLSDLDGKMDFDFSRGGLCERVTGAARTVGFDPKFDGEDIELWRAGSLYMGFDEYPFEMNAYLALEIMRWWLNGDPAIDGGDDPLALLARPFGAPRVAALV